MNKTIIIDYLRGFIDDSKFQQEIGSETKSYQIRKKGSSMPIYSEVTDLVSHVLTKADVIKLLDKYIQNAINESQLEYIVNFCEMTDFISDETIKDKLFEISTPELFGSVTKEKVKKLMMEITQLNC